MKGISQHAMIHHVDKIVNALLRRMFSATAGHCILLGAILAVACVPQAHAQEVSKKYQVMAAFLYNFLLYVEWPSSEEDTSGPIYIGILGENPFGSAATAIEKKSFGGRAIRFQAFSDTSQLKPTPILFIPSAQTEHLEDVREQIAGYPVLLVGEGEHFTRDGGAIRFFEGRNKLGVEINPRAAEETGLKIRSKLMRLASIVDYPLPP